MMIKKFTRRLTIRLPEDLFKYISKKAGKKMSMSDWVRILITVESCRSLERAFKEVKK